jgi:hypothetical protein
MAQVRYTIEEHVCLVQLCLKYESARKSCKKFQRHFPEQPVPSRQSMHYLINKLKTTGSLLDKTPDRKRTVLTEETLGDTGARLETSQRISINHLGGWCFKKISMMGHKIVNCNLIRHQ